MSLLAVPEAQARLLALVTPLATESVSLVEAAGRWAAADVVSLRTQPFADLSAMDGYALRFAELPGPFTVKAESAAGGPRPHPLATGEAMRIFTGAPLPAGADTILIQEEAARDGNQLTLAGEGPGRAGKHIRHRGSDFAEGVTLITRGSLLTPARITLAAAAGHGSLTVCRRVRIGLISTGNELVPAGAEAGPDALPCSNAPMLATLLAGPGVEIINFGIAPDKLEAIHALIDAASDVDIIITTGGASVGDHDLVKPAFEAAGANLDFWKVAMRPGKPLMAGRLGDAVILGLPGNPVSAFVTASLFAKPLIAALGGSKTPIPVLRTATLAAALPSNGSRAQYLRGGWSDGQVTALTDQDSAGLSALAAAELLIYRAANAPEAAAGDQVEVLDIA